MEHLPFLPYVITSSWTFRENCEQFWPHSVMEFQRDRPSTFLHGHNMTTNSLTYYSSYGQQTNRLLYSVVSSKWVEWKSRHVCILALYTNETRCHGSLTIQRRRIWFKDAKACALITKRIPRWLGEWLAWHPKVRTPPPVSKDYKKKRIFSRAHCESVAHQRVIIM